MTAPALAAPHNGLFTVNSTIDTNTPGDNLISLREAILVSNGSLTGPCSAPERAQLSGFAFDPGGKITGGCGAGVPDKILLPAGIYTLTLAGAKDDSSPTGDLDIFSNVAISGGGLGATINANGIDRAIDIQSRPVVITRATLQHGSPPTGVGGGLRIQTGIVSLSNGGIVSNTAADNGGGIYNGGTLDLTAMTINHNAATTGSASGGGIYNAGQLTALSPTR